MSGTTIATVRSAMPIRTPRRPPVPSLRSPTQLQARFAELESLAGATALAIAISDFETEAKFAYHGDRWFHAWEAVGKLRSGRIFRICARGGPRPTRLDGSNARWRGR